MAFDDIHEQHRAALALVDRYRGALKEIAIMTATTPESHKMACVADKALAGEEDP